MFTHPRAAPGAHAPRRRYARYIAVTKKKLWDAHRCSPSRLELIVKIKFLHIFFSHEKVRIERNIVSREQSLR